MSEPGAKALRELLAGQLTTSCAVARIARKPHRCACADETRGCWVVTAFPGGGEPLRVARRTSDEAETTAASDRGRYPDATVTVEPRPNPEYRPGCDGEIKPGDVYVEYLGDSQAFQSGTAYCSRHGREMWGAADGA